MLFKGIKILIIYKCKDVMNRSLYKFGILFFNDLDDDIKLKNVLITDVNVSGFRDGGIAIASCNGESGFKNVTVKNSEIFK